MQVTEAAAVGLKRELNVVVPATTISERMDARLKELAGTVRLPGFRPGKVPAAVVKKRFGESVRGEVLQKLLEETSQAALKEKALVPAMQPQLDDLKADAGQDLAYKMTFEVLPTIEAMDFKTLSIERLSVAVADDKVDEQLAAIAANAKSSRTVSEARPAREGDIIVVSFEGEVEGEKLDALKGNDMHLELGSGMFIPGFEEQMIGSKAGEQKTINVTFPADYGSKAVAGKPATFDITVSELREPVTPAIDDEFAKSMGQETLDKLKDVVRADLGRQYESAARSVMKREILDKLDAAHSFDLPESMVDQEFQAIWAQVQRDKQAGNLDASDAGKSDEELKAEYRRIAERRVKLGLLLSHVGASNEIKITQEDLTQALIAEARKYPGQENEVIKFFQQNQQAQLNLRAPIMEEKTIDFIVALAQVSEKSVSADELQATIEKLEAGLV